MEHKGGVLSYNLKVKISVSIKIFYCHFLFMFLRMDASCFGFDLISKNYLPVLACIFVNLSFYRTFLFWLVFAYYTEGTRSLVFLCATHFNDSEPILPTRRVLLDTVKNISEYVTCSKECHSTFLKVQYCVDFLSKSDLYGRSEYQEPSANNTHPSPAERMHSFTKWRKYDSYGLVVCVDLLCST